MFKQNVLVTVFVMSVTCFIAGSGHAALITMEIDASSMMSDYDLSHTGNELKIDYAISNTTQSSGFSDALYRILIPAGVEQTIYAVQVPDEWTAVITRDEIELYTLNGYKAIQCGESKVFSIYAYNTGKEDTQIQAMTSMGDWAIPELAIVPNGQIPEPATILLLASGVCFLKRRH